jgi:hypothetical protein
MTLPYQGGEKILGCLVLPPDKESGPPPLLTAGARNILPRPPKESFREGFRRRFVWGIVFSTSISPLTGFGYR